MFLRVFDGPHVPVDDIISRLETANRVAGVLHAANVASNALYLVENGVPAVAWDYPGLSIRTPIHLTAQRSGDQTQF